MGKKGERGSLRRVRLVVIAISSTALLVATVLVTTEVAGAAGSRPVISDLAASPATLPNVGGIVSVSATISGGTSCTWSAKPALTDLPVSAPCSTGQVSQFVTVPANKAKTFSVTLTVQGATKRAHADVKIVETKAPPNPMISSVNPSSGPVLGNQAITVTGTNLSTATAVTFGGYNGQVIKVFSDNSVLVSNPDLGTPGAVDTQITLAGNQVSPTVPGDVFTYAEGPSGFPTSIVGTASGVSTINDRGAGNPETTWSGSMTFTWDPSCVDNPVGLSSNQPPAACYEGSFSGNGSHNWYGYGIDGPGDTPICASPLSFSYSDPQGDIGADIQIDAGGNYHLYFNVEEVPDVPPACAGGDLESSNPLVGFEHLLTGDTLGPDGYLMGQTTLSESGQDAGGDGSQMTNNGIAGPGWSGTIDWTFSY